MAPHAALDSNSKERMRHKLIVYTVLAMQPIRVGVNAALVLLILLLSVPLQLLLSNLVTMSTTEENTERDITHTRTEAVEQLVDTAEAVFDSLHSTIMYYSTWSHLKELVLVPHRKMPHTNLKSTVFRSKAGTTTILISSMDATKTTKKSSESTANKMGTKTSKTGNTGAGPSHTDKTGGQAKVISRFHKPTDQTGSEKTTASSKKLSSTTAKRKPVIIEEVSHAKEVEDYLRQEVYFGQSKTPRDRKPSSVKYSVGQVVEHTTANWVGVVIGWDTVAKAPEKWIKQYYANRKGVELTNHYLILVDSKYIASGTPYHYVPQEDIQLGPPQQLRCPEVSEYFEGFQNGRHIPKPWLRNRYPHD